MLGARLARSAVTAILLAVACGTPAPTTNNNPLPADPVIYLDREPLVVASLVGTRVTFNLQILNKGGGTLQINLLRIATTPDGGLPPAIDAGGVFDQPIIIVDGGSSPLPVRLVGTPGFVQFDFQPKDGSATRLNLFVGSNAPAQPELAVALTGCGVWPDGGSDSTACTCTDGGC
jgi:hypothetical protein